MFMQTLRSKARFVIPCFEATRPSSICKYPFDRCFPFPGVARKRSGSDFTNLVHLEETHKRLLPNSVKEVAESHNEMDLFDQMKQRFLRFKEQVYLKELEHYCQLAEVQTPKFMVIACADSRVCPSNILGLQPGEAFTIRNVANFVPPLDNGPSETNAALEFAVNTLKVENILVIGHSRCGGIEALMTMKDDYNTSFVHNWVIKAKAAKSKTSALAPYHSFDQQCKHCEKESVNISLLNLLTYPWVEERVKRKKLSLHGGYYDFLNCTFEKWTLGSIKASDINGDRYFMKDQAFWS